MVSKNKKTVDGGPAAPGATTTTLGDRISKILSAYRLDCSTERALQDAIERVFIAEKIKYIREKILDTKNRVDFWIPQDVGSDGGGLGIECKLAGSASEVFRQVERYTKFPEVGEILLVTTKHMGLPPVVSGKPTSVFKVGLAWL